MPKNPDKDLEKSKRQEKAPKEETLRHKEVFEIYYAMGDARSLRNLGELVGVSLNTIELWSTTFEWQDRIAQRDKQLIRRIQDDFYEESLRFRCYYIDLVKEMIASCLEVDPKTGKRAITIKPSSVSDLEKLIKLHMTLMGEPTGETPQGGSGGGVGNVTIVMPQQLDQNDWTKMVKGDPLTIPHSGGS